MDTRPLSVLSEWNDPEEIETHRRALYRHPTNDHLVIVRHERLDREMNAWIAEDEYARWKPPCEHLELTRWKL